MKKKVPLYNLSLRTLENRLRTFQEQIPTTLKEIVENNADVIISAIANDQLYRRGVNGYDEKIMEYKPYRPRTIQYKKRKQQPYTRVTLRDSGNFHRQMYLVCESDGFYVTSRSKATPFLTKKYGASIFKLTDKNFTRILNSHIRKEFVKRLKQATVK